VAIAFPDMPRYQTLSTATRHALARLGLGVYVARENSAVVELLPPGAIACSRHTGARVDAGGSFRRARSGVRCSS